MSEFSNQANAAGEPKKKKKRGGLALIIGGAVVAAAVGGVFATNVITINGVGGTIELGNGVADTAACDTDGVDTTINQEWNATASDFIVKDVVISDVDATGCVDKDLKVLLIGSGGATVCGVDGTHPSPDYPDADNHIAQDVFTVATGTTSYTVDISGISGAQKTDCLASSVIKVGLETAN